jgi:hypothetical protein
VGDWVAETWVPWFVRECLGSEVGK